MNSFIEELQTRGYIKQSTIDIASLPNNIIPYIGFDCTADSLHIGSLLQLMILRLAVKHNIKPIVLLGGFTTKVGDPSGRNNTRPILDEKTIDNNLNSIAKLVCNMLREDNIELVDNSWWMDTMAASDYIDITRNFNMNTMLSMDSIKNRLDSKEGMSALEFNYSIIQAIDFMKLNERYSCNLQIGGSDQWSNIISGINLIRKLNNKEVYGITTPLLTNSNGDKMGKTVNGAIWLDNAKYSAIDFYQYWRNVDDSRVEEYLKLFTDLPLEEIEKMSKGDINIMKVVLANEVTKIVHGEKLLNDALDHAKEFYDIGNGTDISIEEGALFSKTIAEIFNLSNKEVKRLINQKAIYLDITFNNDMGRIGCVYEDFRVDWSKGTSVLISVGKKRKKRINII